MTTKRKNVNSLENLFKKIKINETNKRKNTLVNLETSFKKIKITEIKKRKEINETEVPNKKVKIKQSVIKPELLTFKDLCVEPIIHAPRYVF